MAAIRNSDEILQLFNGLAENSIATNVQTTYVVTTEDKIRILYDEYSEIRKKADYMFNWFGILVTLLITDFSCEFKNVLFMDEHIVSAIFYFATVVCAIYFFNSLYHWVKNKEKLEFSFFINKLKGNN